MFGDRPKLIVVTGRPGSGKTTFATELSKQIHCPLVSRDSLKEGLVNTKGRSHHELGGEANKVVYQIFFSSIQNLLESDVSLIAEAAFQHGLWEKGLLELSTIAEIYILICDPGDELAHKRVTERANEQSWRDWYHGDKANLIEVDGKKLPVAEYKKPDLNFPTMSVSTTAENKNNFSEVCSFLKFKLHN